MLPKGTRKKAFRLSSLEEKSMELVQVEIGLPKGHTYWESNLSLLKVSKESTEAI